MHTVFSIWPIDRTLSGATTPCQNRPGSNGNEGVLHILQISKAGASPSNCLMSYPGHSLWGWGLTPPTEMQSVYSTAPADWTELVFEIQISQNFWLTKIKSLRNLDGESVSYLKTINFFLFLFECHCRFVPWRSQISWVNVTGIVSLFCSFSPFQLKMWNLYLFKWH